MRRVVLLLFTVLVIAAPAQAHDVGQTIKHREHKIERITKQIHQLKVDRRLARRDIRWLKVIRPFQAWLESTGDCENANYGGADLHEGTDAYNPSPFFGRYQFTLQSWAAVGGHGDPRDASWIEQAYRAILLRWKQGIGAWPVCGH